MMKPRQLVRLAISSVGPGAIILAYHRVADLDTDPQLLAVSREQFEGQMKVLSERFKVIPLSDVLTRTKPSHTPRIAITFDDGYRDNLSYAAPILRKLDLPATFFVSTGYIGEEREFWWDELESIMLHGELPHQLILNLPGQNLAFELPDRGGPVDPKWDVTQLHDPGSRYTIYRRMHSVLRTTHPLKRDQILDYLWKWKCDDKVVRTTHLPLRSRDVTKLGDGELLSIGSHGITHSVFSALSAEEGCNEATNSRRQLEELVSVGVHSFSFPYGKKSDLNGSALRALSAGGYKLACANYAGWVNFLSDHRSLPRFLVRDWSAAEFSQHLGEWSSALP